MKVKDKTLAALKRLDERFSNAENWIKGAWAAHGFKPGALAGVVETPPEGFYMDNVGDLIDRSGRWLKPGEPRFTDDGRRMRRRVRKSDLETAKKCDQFCLEGAMYRVGIKQNDPAWQIVEGITRRVSGRGIVSFNDAEDTTFEMVRSVVTRAVKVRKDQLVADYRAKL